MTATARNFYDAAFAKVLKHFLPLDIKIEPGRAGFFGEVFCTLNGLRLAQLYRRRAVVVWGACSPYFEARYGQNAWTNFFQSAEFNFSNDSKRVGIFLPYRPSANDFSPYDGLNVRRSVAKALHAWCQPRSEIVAAVSEFLNKNFCERKMLGVHLRLTDVAAGFEGRNTVDLKNFIMAIDSWLEIHQDSGIFLASDDQHAVKKLIDRYPERIVLQDCMRSEDGTSIHGHYDKGIAGSPYQKGREVLIDALLLANCDHLIRTHSRVTAFSLCWNPELTFQDLEYQTLKIERLPWLRM
jgi:hypothetical protein